MAQNHSALAEAESDVRVERSIENQIVDLLPAMRAYSRLLARDPIEADDLLQEALLRAVGHVHQFTPGTNLKAWLFKILRNTHFTARSKRSREMNLRANVMPEGLGVAAAQGWVESLHRVQEALELLPHEQKDLLILVCGAGFSYEEAAGICNCTMGTVKSRINRGRHKLAQLLGIEATQDLAGDSLGPNLAQLSRHAPQGDD